MSFDRIAFERAPHFAWRSNAAVEDETASVRDFDAIPLSEEERLKLHELNSRRVFRLGGPIG
jgi:hypothetical protein